VARRRADARNFPAICAKHGTMGRMLTLGVDLAAQDRHTAIPLVRWNATGVEDLFG
jgi:hypothetical protein